MAELKLPPFTVQQELNPAEIPWGVQHINAPKAWETSKGENVIVAILDTGADKNHPDLAGRIIDGRNFTNDYNGDVNNFADNQGHGSHCAGTIAGVIDNNGVIGVAPEVKLVIGKVLDRNGSGSYTSIINGIKWATAWKSADGKKVDVISMSLGGPQDYSPLHTAIQAAVNAGISVVCAAGNEGDGNVNTNEFAFPGSYAEVIEVGAIDSNDNVASFSNTNAQLDIAAPGVDIVSIAPNNQYAKMSGTSMATPHVAGALAVIVGAYRKQGIELTEPEKFEKLKQYVRQLSANKTAVGNGVVDFAVAELPKDPEPQPAPVPVEPAPVEVEQVETQIVERDGKFFIEIGPFTIKPVFK